MSYNSSYPSALTLGLCDATAFSEGAAKRSCREHQRCLAQKRAVIKKYPNMK